MKGSKKLLFLLSLFALPVTLFLYRTEQPPKNFSNTGGEPKDSQKHSQYPANPSGKSILTQKSVNTGGKAQSLRRMVHSTGMPELYYFPAYLAQCAEVAQPDLRYEQLQKLRALRSDDPKAKAILEREEILKEKTSRLTVGVGVDQLVDFLGFPTIAFVRKQSGKTWDLIEVSIQSEEFRKTPGFAIYSPSGSVSYRPMDVHEIFIVYFNSDLRVADFTWCVPAERIQ